MANRRSSSQRLRMAAHGEAHHGDATGFGAFVGYNSQWDDVVVGLEVNYIHGKFGGHQTGASRGIFNRLGAPQPARRIEGDRADENFRHRRRCAPAAATSWGSFLPYAFAGIALGQADIIDRPRFGLGRRPLRLASAWRHQRHRRQYAHLIYGYPPALGIDVMLVGGLFLRAEWEYRPLYVVDRHQRQHGARRPRLQVLIRPGTTSIRTPLTDLPPPVALSP